MNRGRNKIKNLNKRTKKKLFGVSIGEHLRENK
jgi:hypothetical protein